MGVFKNINNAIQLYKYSTSVKYKHTHYTCVIYGKTYLRVATTTTQSLFLLIYQGVGLVDEAILKSDQGSSAFVVGVKSSEKSPKETAGQREHRSGQQMYRGGSCRERWEK